jgi:hypothetical protein
MSASIVKEDSFALKMVAWPAQNIFTCKTVQNSPENPFTLQITKRQDPPM